MSGDNSGEHCYCHLEGRAEDAAKHCIMQDSPKFLKLFIYN